jgi:RimJ/RimL family protein N-acetyltransferase
MQLETERLILRPPSTLDAPRMSGLGGEYEVARGTLTMPHPYTEADASDFIDSTKVGWEKLSPCIFAIIHKAEQALIGMIGVHTRAEHKHADLGYWIGIPYWNQGYATEAARGTIDWCFEQLGLNRVYAEHFGSNPASGKVMQKIGMTYEGTLRQHYIRFGAVQDVLIYSILRSEWAARQKSR